MTGSSRTTTDSSAVLRRASRPADGDDQAARTETTVIQRCSIVAS